VSQLLEDIARGGHSGVGKAEPLKGEFAGFWSRRIDEVNRLVYRPRDGAVEILSCREIPNLRAIPLTGSPSRADARACSI
jgi:Txe/YoeB family toxin of toxin-antitoxin system